MASPDAQQIAQPIPGEKSSFPALVLVLAWLIPGSGHMILGKWVRGLLLLGSILGLAIVLGYPHIGWLFFVLGLWRVIQDYVNAPRIMGKQLEINPLATIFGVLAGGEIGGVIGALVAVPVLAILRILWRRLESTDLDNTPAMPQLRASQLPDKPQIRATWVLTTSQPSRANAAVRRLQTPPVQATHTTQPLCRFSLQVGMQGKPSTTVRSNIQTIAELERDSESHRTLTIALPMSSPISPAPCSSSISTSSGSSSGSSSTRASCPSANLSTPTPLSSSP